MEAPPGITTASTKPKPRRRRRISKEIYIREANAVGLHIFLKCGASRFELIYFGRAEQRGFGCGF